MKRALECAILCVALFAAAGAALSATPDDCQALRKHGHRAEAQACYQSLTQTRDLYLRAEGDWGGAIWTPRRDLEAMPSVFLKAAREAL